VQNWRPGLSPPKVKTARQRCLLLLGHARKLCGGEVLVSGTGFVFVVVSIVHRGRSRRVELAQRSADLKFDNGVALIKSTLAAWVDSVRESSEKEVQERVGAAHQRKSELTDRVLQLDHAIEVINRELSTIDRVRVVLQYQLKCAVTVRLCRARMKRWCSTRLWSQQRV
jgi:hypothetical protein